ncbi:MAG: transcriptional regulator [Deltaproteobacteria bacterium]|nr:transcriptional regulator [Deltaproteobacteria bacterium]
MKVPLLNLKLQYAQIKDEIKSSINEVLESQQFIFGPQVESFEKEIAHYTQADHAIGVSSGTDALLISLMTLKIGKGDMVITSPFSFFSTASSISRVGATPIFIDIDPLTYNISPRKINEAISCLKEDQIKRVKAIMPVHLYGQCADMDSIVKIANKYNLKIIEDAAQALGAKYQNKDSAELFHHAGSRSDFGCFSFFPTKNLGGYGEGGMVVTGRKLLADKVQSLRHHGCRSQQEQYYYDDIIGINGRFDALQAAVLKVKLKHLDQWTTKRRLNADNYNKLFKETGLVSDIDDHKLEGSSIGLPYVEDGNYHVFNQYVIRARERDKLKEFFNQHGIGSGIYYPLPIHLQQCYLELGYKEGSFKEAERAASEVLALPVYPELTGKQQELVVTTTEQFYKKK